MHARDQLFPTSQAAPRFIVGDTVEVLRAARLPKVQEVIGCATVIKVTGEHPNQLYWLEGRHKEFKIARSARELRLVLRGDGR